MQIFLTPKNLLLVFLLSTPSFTTDSSAWENIYKAAPIGCIVSKCSEPELLNYHVSFTSKEVNEYKKNPSYSYGILERGIEIPVDDEVSLLMFELRGSRTVHLYDPNDKEKIIFISALLEGIDIGIEGGVDGFMMYWFNYNPELKLQQPEILNPKMFKHYYFAKFKGTPVRILEFRETREQFEKTVDDPYNIIQQTDRFYIEFKCDLRILDANMYVDSNLYVEKTQKQNAEMLF
jgi:hypothetical protein